MVTTTDIRVAQQFADDSEVSVGHAFELVDTHGVGEALVGLCHFPVAYRGTDIDSGPVALTGWTGASGWAEKLCREAQRWCGESIDCAPHYSDLHGHMTLGLLESHSPVEGGYETLHRRSWERMVGEV